MRAHFITLIVVGLMNVTFINAQTNYIDSIKTSLKKPVSNDTMRAFQYNELAWSLLDFDLKQASQFQKKGFQFSKKIGYTNGMADALNTQGIILRIQNKPKEAIAVYEKLIRLRNEQKNRSKLIGAYSNLGSVYYESGNNAFALKYYDKAFQLSLELGEKDKQLVLLMNLGVAYKSSGLYEQAIQTFKKGIELNKKLKDRDQEIQIYLNIATVYDERKLYTKAVESNEYALSLLKLSPNKRIEGIVLYNLVAEYRKLHMTEKERSAIQRLGQIEKQLNEKELSCSYSELMANYYNEQERLSDALKSVDRAYSLSDSLIDPVSYVDILLTKADILRKLSKFDQSISWAKRAQTFIVDNELEKTLLIKVYETFYDIYKSQKNWGEALSALEKSRELKEVSTLETVNDQIATLNSLNELDRKEKDLELAQAKNEKIELDNERKGALIAGGGITGLLVLVLLVFSYRAYRNKRKANVLLHHQKEEIIQQKHLIEEKQNEIVDSIHYAKRIQNTLLASEKLIEQNVKDCFIFFRPKDIVSGDFYWCSEQDNLFYFAICDSTGHGVPGAFMSLLNITFLSEAINEKKIRSTAEILNHVRARLIANISQEGAQDGMDGVLFCYDKSNSVLRYSAAYNAPVLVRNEEIVSLKADKMPIGKGEKNESFTEHEITLEKGDVVFAYTDGYGDQFGGPRGKKFKSSQLNDLLLNNVKHSFESQKKILESTFENWSVNEEQVDDVTVVGIQFNQ